MPLAVDVSGYFGCRVAGGATARDGRDERVAGVWRFCRGVPGDAGGGDATVFRGGEMVAQGCADLRVCDGGGESRA